MRSVKKAKSTLALILVIVLVANIGIFAKMSYNKTHVVGDTIVLRIGHTVAEDHAIHQAMLMFKEEIETISDGRFEVKIYPNSALGGDRQLVESIILGYIHSSVPPTSVLAGFDSRFMVMDLPFIFKSNNAALAALNGELGEEMNEIMESMGLHNAAWSSSGYRYLTTNGVQATSPEEIKNLSVRTQENPIHVASFRAWGASPTPMAFSELFTSLQQGAVDAQENPMAVIVANRFYEVQDTLNLTGHFLTVGALPFSDDFYQTLEGEDKENFDIACQHFGENYSRLVVEQEADLIEEAAANGMEVINLTSEQKDAFIQQAASVYDLFIEEYAGTQELIDKAMMYNDIQ